VLGACPQLCKLRLDFDHYEEEEGYMNAKAKTLVLAVRHGQLNNLQELRLSAPFFHHFASLASAMAQMFFPSHTDFQVEIESRPKPSVALARRNVEAMIELIASGALPAIKELPILASVGLKDVHLLPILNALEGGRCPYLISLTFHLSGLSVRSATALARLLISGTMPRLQQLDLNRSKDSEATLCLLQAMLGVGGHIIPCLKELNLEDCHLDARHAYMLQDILRSGVLPAIARQRRNFGNWMMRVLHLSTLAWRPGKIS